jgi:polygalacturonase
MHPKEGAIHQQRLFTEERMTAIVTDFGAIPNGKTLNTDAIQRAIDTCAEAGGGTVVFPPGRFLSGTLELRSYVDLFLEAGAVASEA